MKNIEEIKEEYAINLAGYNTWDELISDELGYRVEIHTDQVAERYAKSKTQELQEQNAELVNFLQFLSRKGGLGLDVHEKIDNILTKYNQLKQM